MGSAAEGEPSMTFKDPDDIDKSCPWGSRAVPLAGGVIYILPPPIAVAAAAVVADTGML